jgi:hypothetical protein
VAAGDVGLAAGARRRAPGLRREEVAALAAMSTDYYTRLEQQRGPQLSAQMLASARPGAAKDERDYLFRVAGHRLGGRQAVTLRSGTRTPGRLRRALR